MYLTSIYKFDTFWYICLMIIMRQSNVQTSENDHRAIMYTIICVHHKTAHNSSKESYRIDALQPDTFPLHGGNVVGVLQY